MLAWTGYVGHNKIARHRLLNEAASGADANSLEKIFTDGTASRDLEVLSKLAKNPNTPLNDLVHLYDFCKPNVAKSDPSEYPVLFSLARNPRTPPDILVVLATCRPSSIRSAVARNPSTSTKTLRQLTEDQDGSVRTYAKSLLGSRKDNSKSPQE